MSILETEETFPNFYNSTHPSESSSLLDPDHSNSNNYSTDTLSPTPLVNTDVDSILINSKLTNSKIFFYAIGETSTNIVATVKGFFFNAFLLEVAGIRPSDVALIMFISTFIDAITDPMVGRLSDKTETRIGRRRPWLIAGSLPLGFLWYLLWQTPFIGLPEEGYSAFTYYAIVSIATTIAYTIIFIPYTSLTPEIAHTYHDRTKLTMGRMSLGLFIGTIAAYSHAEIVSAGNPTEAQGYSLSALIFGIIMVFPPLITAYFTREEKYELEVELAKRKELLEDAKRRENNNYQIVSEDDEISSLTSSKSIFAQISDWFTSPNSLLRNKPFLIVLYVFGATQTCVAFVQTNLILYVKYVLDLSEYFSIAILLVQLGAALSMPLWTILAKRFGKPKVFYVGVIFWAATQLALFWIPGNVYLILTLSAFAGIGVSVGAFLIPWSLLPDVIDYDELQTGKLRQGLFYALFVFWKKLSLAITLMFSNYALESAGYINPDDLVEDDAPSMKLTKPSQPPNVSHMLRIMMGPIPAALLLSSILVMKFYPISPEKLDEIHQKLIAKRKKQGIMTPTDEFQVTAFEGPLSPRSQ